ncbi:MAG: bifunctional folylpolyglutamate synthase/dihydrofolate synthase, partial [Peptococcaceae bacterium]|nr:bifunctional folylpolyglutamate synthase/dihydrofolate synthase [Peptococcaceae bacterium]
GQRFCYKTWQNLSIRLLGEYQLMNAITALEALWVLQEHDSRLTDDTIRQGLEQASWPGRFEIIGEKPLFIVDGAHNPAGAQALADAIQHLHSSKAISDTGSVWLLMGVFRDKAYEEIGRIMSQCGNQLITFQPPGERGLESEVLAEAMKPYYTKIEMKQTAEDAVQYVMQHASAEDIIISFGSLSTIKAVQDAVKAWEGERNGK